MEYKVLDPAEAKILQQEMWNDPAYSSIPNATEDVLLDYKVQRDGKKGEGQAQREAYNKIIEEEKVATQAEKDKKLNDTLAQAQGKEPEKEIEEKVTVESFSKKDADGSFTIEDYEKMDSEVFNDLMNTSSEDLVAKLKEAYPDLSDNELFEKFTAITGHSRERYNRALGLEKPVEEETTVEKETVVEETTTEEPVKESMEVESITEKEFENYAIDKYGKSMEDMINEINSLKAEGTEEATAKANELSREAYRRTLIDNGVMTEDGKYLDPPTEKEFLKEIGSNSKNWTLASVAIGLLTGGRIPIVDFGTLSGDKRAYEERLNSFRAQQAEAERILGDINEAAADGTIDVIKSKDEAALEAGDLMAQVEGQREVYRQKPLADLMTDIRNIDRMADADVVTALTELQDRLSTDSAMTINQQLADLDVSKILREAEQYSTMFEDDPSVGGFAVLMEALRKIGGSDKKIKKFFVRSL